MGLTQNHVLGRNTKCYTIYESTPGTPEPFVATNGTAGNRCLRLLGGSVSQTIERKNRSDSFLTSRDYEERITGKKTTEWSLDAYLIPSGSAGQQPDCGDLLRAAMGTQTLTPATSAAYTLASAQAFPTLTLSIGVSNLLAAYLWGVWVEEVKLAFSGGDEPKINASGGAMGSAITGWSTLDSAAVDTASIEIQDAQINSFPVGSIIQVGSDTNTNAGFRVTANDGTDDLSLAGDAGDWTGVATAAAADGSDVIPFLPSFVDYGTPIANTTGSLTLSGEATTSLALPITAANLSIKNNFKPLGDLAFQQSVTDVITGMRDVTGDISVRLRKDVIPYLLNRTGFAAYTIDLTAGTTAGSIVTVDLNQVELEFSEIAFPESEEATVTIPFRCLGTSSGNDSIASLTFT